MIGFFLFFFFIFINSHVFSFNYQHGLVNHVCLFLLMANWHMCSLIVPVKEMVSRNTLDDSIFCFGPLKLLLSDYSYVFNYFTEILDNKPIPKEKGREMCVIFSLMSGLPNKLNKRNNFFFLILECI